MCQTVVSQNEIRESDRLWLKGTFDHVMFSKFYLNESIPQLMRRRIAHRKKMRPLNRTFNIFFRRRKKKTGTKQMNPSQKKKKKKKKNKQTKRNTTTSKRTRSHPTDARGHEY